MTFWRKETKKMINRNYVSKLDRFLMEFDKNPEATSSSRKKEEDQYQKIALLRDNEQADNNHNQLWGEF